MLQYSSMSSFNSYKKGIKRNKTTNDIVLCKVAVIFSVLIQ